MFGFILSVLVVINAINIGIKSRNNSCHIETVPFYWTDGTESVMKITVCDSKK